MVEVIVWALFGGAVLLCLIALFAEERGKCSRR
jgi:hypothetical protein